MPIDRPSATELVCAVREHLAEQLAPLLEGQPAFHLRVAVNALAIVERTLSEGDAMDSAEKERLCALLRSGGDLVDLNRQLSTAIRAGDMDDRRVALLDHLRKTAEDKLDLTNPGYKVSRGERKDEG